MSEPKRTLVRHFAVNALFADGIYFPVCGTEMRLGDLSLGPRLSRRWRDVTCKRCLQSRETWSAKR